MSLVLETPSKGKEVGIQTAILATANTSGIFIVLLDKCIVKVGINNTGINIKMIKEKHY